MAFGCETHSHLPASVMRLVILSLLLQTADTVIHQYPPLVRGDIGSNISLTCLIEDMTGYCFSVVWFKLELKRSPHLIPFNAYVRGSDVSTGEPVDKTCVLTLIIREENDSGTFFCAYVRGSSVYIGNGSTVVVRNVTAGVVKPMSIVTITPDNRVPSENNTAELVCVVFRALSDQLRVHWVIAGQVRQGMKASGAMPSGEVAPNIISNRIIIEERAWKDGTPFTCVVETETGQRFNKTVSKKGGIQLTLTLLRVLEILLFFLAVSITVCFLSKKK
ncbi:uncharacterized protein [Lepisosteus oculatus]|uniref:uncharacterized protein isoform X1 n=2 Tax=Lepisosteus oculatus TaxID=7918 RepID=UPI00073FDA8A|nr:PREDICTED: uncharacterized protein LOC107079134 isoform X2 [Lepisosteus oculatus]